MPVSTPTSSAARTTLPKSANLKKVANSTGRPLAISRVARMTPACMNTESSAITAKNSSPVKPDSAAKPPVLLPYGSTLDAAVAEAAMIAKKTPEITTITARYASTPSSSGPTFWVNLVQPQLNASLTPTVGPLAWYAGCP